jgi:hypothetical protein
MGKSCLEIEEDSFFKKIDHETYKITKPTPSWPPSWHPQATLQYPLKCTVDLFKKVLCPPTLKISPKISPRAFTSELIFKASLPFEENSSVVQL